MTFLFSCLTGDVSCLLWLPVAVLAGNELNNRAYERKLEICDWLLVQKLRLLKTMTQSQGFNFSLVFN